MLNKKIYLCGIGAQKSGTTFIGNYLSKHPDFCMSPLKELHYFNTLLKPNYSGAFEKKLLKNINELIEDFNNNENINATLLIAMIKRIEAARKNNYKSYFRYFVQEQHLAFGEITPAYSTLNRDGFQSIIDTFPNYRFLFLLRNPVDRFWSQINFELKNSTDNINPISIIDEKLNDPAYLLRSDYKRTLEELLSVADTQKVLVMFYEDLFSSSGNETMKKISEFLGIENRIDLYNVNKKVNITQYSSNLSQENRQKIACYFTDVYQYLLNNYEVPQKWRDDFHQL